MKHKNQHKHSAQRQAPHPISVFAETLRNSCEILEIDLHGYTVQEAVDNLEKTIDKAMLSGVKQINIIHGFGSGKVKNAVHKYLQNFKHVSSFRLSINNPGVTIVYM